jgi:hypothetical protein
MTAKAVEVTSLRLSNQLPPIINLSDLLRMAFDEAYLKEFYPSLTAESRGNIYKDILLWMKHCVLEDKLDRLLSLCRADSEHQLVKELEVHRVWKAEDHPRWLVFEVEGRLQIRPKQYIVANAILNNAGAIVQLNMGEGKTRVIIPMIIMQLTSSATAKDNWSIPRIYFLTALLSEGFAHIHEFLTASVLNVKLFCLPFNRDVDLDMNRVYALHNTFAACKQEKGVVVVAPEHRLSLHLKRFDLTTTTMGSEDNVRAIRDRLIEVEKRFTFVDILDESDEILRHKYNLIYSVGNHMGLEAGTHRWTVCQALLMAIKRDANVRQLLSSPALAKIEPIDELSDCNSSPAF